MKELRSEFVYCLAFKKFGCSFGTLLFDEAEKSDCLLQTGRSIAAWSQSFSQYPSSS
jgi:hypothetical protein